MVDVANAAGVSLATVGRVLQGTGGKNIRVGRATAQKVRKIAQDLNYKPNYAARQLAGKKSHTIGILIDPSPYPSNSIRFAEMGSRARQKGYQLMALHEVPDPGLIEECLGEFRGRGVDGMICMHHAYPGQHDLVPSMVLQSGIENVVFIDQPSISGSTFIGVDFVDAGRQMVNYLFEKGRKRIAFATNDLDWYAGPHFCQGYVNALEKKGIEPNDDLIWIGTKHRKLGSDSHDIDDDTARRIIRDLVKNNHADAIVTSDDTWAAQIINALRDEGVKVPEDLSVTGSGNLDISRYLRPKLTTADLCHKKVSYKAVDMLIDKIENNHGGSEPKGVFVRPKIIIRDST